MKTISDWIYRLGKQAYFRKGSDMQVEVTNEQSERAGAGTRVHDDYRKRYWAKRRERLFAIASQAEGEHDYFRAGRAFVLALFCDGRLQGKCDNPWLHAYECMPVY